MIKTENYIYENNKLSRVNSTTNEQNLNDPNKYIEFKKDNSNYPNELLQFPEFIAGLTAIITNTGLIGFKKNSEIVSVYDIQSYTNIDFEKIKPDYFGSMISYNEINNPLGLRRIKYTSGGVFESEYTISVVSKNIIETTTSKYSLIDADALYKNTSTGPEISTPSDTYPGFFYNNLAPTAIMFAYKPAFIFNKNVTAKVCYKDSNDFETIDTEYDQTNNKYLLDLSNINPNDTTGYVYISLGYQGEEGYLEVY